MESVTFTYCKLASCAVNYPLACMQTKCFSPLYTTVQQQSNYGGVYCTIQLWHLWWDRMTTLLKSTVCLPLLVLHMNTYLNRWSTLSTAFISMKKNKLLLCTHQRPHSIALKHNAVVESPKPCPTSRAGSARVETHLITPYVGNPVRQYVWILSSTDKLMPKDKPQLSHVPKSKMLHPPKEKEYRNGDQMMKWGQKRDTVLKDILFSVMD